MKVKNDSPDNDSDLEFYIFLFLFLKEAKELDRSRFLPRDGRTGFFSGRAMSL